MASFAEWQQKKYDYIRMIVAYSERNVVILNFFLPCYASIRCIGISDLVWNTMLLLHEAEWCSFLKCSAASN